MSEPEASPDSFTAGFPRVGDPGSQASILPALGPSTIGIPDSLVDVATCGPFEIRGCSSRGMSHRYAGTPRQDAFALATDDDWVVVAVCDGVSSGRQSHVAADTAARSICKLVLDALARDGVVDWTAVSNRVSRRIVEEARYRQIVDLADVSDSVEVLRAVRDRMSTTAVAAAISRHTHNDDVLSGELVVIAGDSGAFTISATGVAPLIGGKDNEGSFTSGSVRPLPGSVTPQTRSFTLGRGEAVLLVTDGIGDPLGAGDSTLGRMIADAWRTPPPIGRFLDEVNFLQRSYDDDRTAVGLWWVHDAADRPVPTHAEALCEPGEVGPPIADSVADHVPVEGHEPGEALVVPAAPSAPGAGPDDTSGQPGAPADAAAGAPAPTDDQPLDPYAADTVVITLAKVDALDEHSEAGSPRESDPATGQWVDRREESP